MEREVFFRVINESNRCTHLADTLGNPGNFQSMVLVDLNFLIGFLDSIG